MAADPTFAHRSGEIRRRGIMTAAIIAVVVVVLRYVPLTSSLFFFSLLENYAYDLAHDYAVPSPPDDIVIIAIDGESMLPKHHLGRWPWRREVHAQLLRKLTRARVVAFDVLFTEPERPSAAEKAKGETGDEVFATAMERSGNVVLAMYKRGKAEYGTGTGGVDWSYPSPQGRVSLRGIQPVNFLQPIERLARAAAAIGYVDIDADADGVYRRVDPLRQGYDGKIYPHFATAIARVATGMTPEQIASTIPDSYLRIGELPAGLSADGSMLISYCGSTGTVPRYSYWQVLEEEVSPLAFKDKIVLVGATAEGLYDIRPAPYRAENRLFFGVETNANIVNTLLHLRPRYDKTTDLAWAVFALALGLLVGWTAWSGGEVIGPALAAGIVAIIAVPSFFVVFSRFDTVIPYGAVLLAAVVPLVVAIPERLGRDKRMVRQQFSVYVSPEVLRELGQDPELVAQGVRREVTLLFADVRGSTTLSENIPAETWVAQLNEYLTQMSEAIFNYDGYLDKFMGDGIMAMWNAFGNQPNHADLAAGAALEMLERLERLNQHWETREGRTPLRIGVAVHTGEAIIGNVGSEERMQYTAIGDTVNTASRIEGLTKQYGVMFIASETSARRLSEGTVELREIGEAEVRGREGRIRIFTRAGEHRSETATN